MRTRASSAICLMVFTKSRRRSSESSGIGSRITLPSVAGLIPSFDSLIARSMSFVVCASKGWITSIRGSGAEITASCFSFICVP